VLRGLRARHCDEAALGSMLAHDVLDRGAESERRRGDRTGDDEPELRAAGKDPGGDEDAPRRDGADGAGGRWASLRADATSSCAPGAATSVPIDTPSAIDSLVLETNANDAMMTNAAASAMPSMSNG
jgi:hypothetical protein